MSYTYRDDIATADVAFEAKGNTIEEVFLSAWVATLNTMIEQVESVEMKSTRRITVTGTEPDMLLYDFLGKLIFYKDACNELLRVREMELRTFHGHYEISAVLSGEPIDTDKHRMLLDVKAVTFHRLAVVQTPSGWSATVVLDV
jgi:SHS2 domain-containing protein